MACKIWYCNTISESKETSRMELTKTAKVQIYLSEEDKTLVLASMRAYSAAWMKEYITNAPHTDFSDEDE